MKTAIVISSCDAFIDCWTPMIYSLNKFWADCPYPIYFISNDKKINDEKIKFINVGEDKGFASNLKYALNQIECDYVIYFQEDYFLTDHVNAEAIKNHISHCYDNNIDFLKIHANDFLLRDNYRIGESDYCANPIDVRYSINTSVAVWKKDTLEKLCVEGYSGWDWERNIISFMKSNGIVINSEMLHSSCYKDKSIISLAGGAVTKGRWTQVGKSFLLENGFKDLLEKRDIEGKFIASIGKFYNQHPKSVLRFPIVVVVRIFLKFNINF
jgi:hypothetical protein